MKIIKEKFKEDKRRDCYWGRIYFISDNREYKARLLWAATREFVLNSLAKETIEKGDVDRFVNGVVNKWKVLKKGVFFPNPRFDVYAASPEDEDKLSQLLRDNDKV